MISPYELLVGLALLREKKRRSESTQQGGLESWSALVVMIGGQRCLIRQDEVDEVVAPGRLTSVLGMPSWMLGLTYFRGHLLNVIDSKAFFLGNQKRSVLPAASRILAVQGQEEWFGLRVDELLGIRHIWSDSVKVQVLEDKKAWRGFAQYKISLEGETMPLLQVKKLASELEQRGIPAMESAKG